MPTGQGAAKGRLGVLGPNVSLRWQLHWRREPRARAQSVQASCGLSSVSCSSCSNFSLAIEAAQICPYCRASKKIVRLAFTDFSRDARHRRTLYTQQQWMDWQRPHLQSPLTTVPGWHLWRVSVSDCSSCWGSWGSLSSWLHKWRRLRSWSVWLVLAEVLPDIMHVLDLGLVPLAVASFLWETTDDPQDLGFMGSLAFHGPSRQRRQGLSCLAPCHCLGCPATPGKRRLARAARVRTGRGLRGVPRVVHHSRRRVPSGRRHSWDLKSVIQTWAAAVNPAEVSSSAGAFQAGALRPNLAEHPNLTQQHMNAYQGRVMVYWIAQKTAPGPGTEYDLVRHAAFLCLVALDAQLRLAAQFDGFLSVEHRVAAEEAGLGFLASYHWLATTALERGVVSWKLMPKHHSFCHLILDFLKVGNPRVLHNYADEDLAPSLGGQAAWLDDRCAGACFVVSSCHL